MSKADGPAGGSSAASLMRKAEAPERRAATVGRIRPPARWGGGRATDATTSAVATAEAPAHGAQAAADAEPRVSVDTTTTLRVGEACSRAGSKPSGAGSAGPPAGMVQTRVAEPTPKRTSCWSRMANLRAAASL